MKKMLMKALLASLFAGTMANAQDAAEIKKIDAKDLPKSGDWVTSIAGWRAQKSVSKAWAKENVNVLQVIIPEKWERERSNRGGFTRNAFLKHSIVYKAEDGQVYYASGLLGKNSHDLDGDTVETVDKSLLKPEFLVEGIGAERSVDVANIKQVSKYDLPANGKWYDDPEGHHAIVSIGSNWRKCGVNVLEVRTTSEKWEKLLDSKGDHHNLYTMKYNLLYRQDGTVYYVSDLTAIGEDGDEFKNGDVTCTHLIPEAIVFNYDPKKFTNAELDTMTSFIMDNFPKLGVMDAQLLRSTYEYARYNIQEDVIAVYPKTSDWVTDGASEKVDFDMIHKRADGKVVFTYGYSVSRKDAENFSKAKAWKKKMHEIEVVDWSEERWKKEADPTETDCARRSMDVTKADLPKDAWNDAAVNKALMKLTKEKYPTIKKVIIRSQGYEYTTNALGGYINRHVKYDIVYVRKTNVSTRTIYKPGFVARQDYNGKSFDKSWTNQGYLVTSGDHHIVDWK
ncbi:MAG: hypothetical protein MJY87_09070 [Fibrobacter sp.]|nr:hypothetical protein [Fibrobacter sp.]